MTLPLANRTIALAEGRQLEELAQMLSNLEVYSVRALDLTRAGLTPWQRSLVTDVGRFPWLGRLKVLLT